MGKVNDKLQEIINFFELEEGYSRQEVISDALGEIEELKGYAADEIGLVWDDEEELMLLEDFAERFYRLLIDEVCNVLESYKEEEEGGGHGNL